VTKCLVFRFAFLPIALLVAAFCPAQADLSAQTRKQIDDIASRVLAATGVPSVSLAVVKDDQIAYLHAYGDARLDPRVAAKPEMRYSVGSISKQFTATAILMLAEEGKLSLDDPVSRFLPTLTRSNQVTIRQLLSHTSGYQDYWPQDYVPPFMLQAVTADKILDLWARKPLDFDPGTQWQYSNTNFVIAGLIVEKASGTPLLDFLRTRIFTPLHMQSVMNIDQERLGETDTKGYLRYALGPPRVAPKEGKGWLFAAGELAMPAEDLAKWDIAMLRQSLLQSASYRAMQTEVVLKSGLGTEYGLGIGVKKISGHRELEHSGEVSGFTAENIVLPDEHAAVVVLVNEDSSDAANDIGKQIANLILLSNDAATAQELQRARDVFTDLQRGKINRRIFTDNANSYFTDLALGDFAASLGPLGTPVEFTQTEHEERGGMVFRRYSVKFSHQVLDIWMRTMPDAKIEQYQIMAKDPLATAD
jgi:CubicO group peptidase (beta-lactamase class C family)